MIPVHLLVLATQLVSSTAVCAVEIWGTKGWPQESIDNSLNGDYAFGIVGVF